MAPVRDLLSKVKLRLPDPGDWVTLPAEARLRRVINDDSAVEQAHERMRETNRAHVRFAVRLIGGCVCWILLTNLPTVRSFVPGFITFLGVVYCGLLGMIAVTADTWTRPAMAHGVLEAAEWLDRLHDRPWDMDMRREAARQVWVAGRRVSKITSGRLLPNSTPRCFRRVVRKGILDMRDAITGMAAELARLESQAELHKIQDDLCRAAFRLTMGYEWQVTDLVRPNPVALRRPLPAEKQIRSIVQYVGDVLRQSQATLLATLLTFVGVVITLFYAKK